MSPVVEQHLTPTCSREAQSEGAYRVPHPPPVPRVPKNH